MKVLLIVFLSTFGLTCYAKSKTFQVADVEKSTGRFDDLSLEDAAYGIKKHYRASTENPRANFRRRRETGKSKNTKENLQFETGDVNFDLANLKSGSGFNSSKHLGTPIKHSFLAAAMTAYNLHLPLELSADDFWLLVALSMSQHLGQSDVAEEYRDRFVNHTGKKELVVFIDQYGIYPHGDKTVNRKQWPNAIRDMMNQIILNTDTDFSEVMTDGFSTSSTAELTAFRVALMESMKNYFEYTFGILCGIPEITLKGTEADFEDLLNRIDSLISIFSDFQWYLGRIRNHAQKLLDTVRGSPDVDWWENMVKVQTEIVGCGSEETHISGWMADWIAYYTGTSFRGEDTLIKLEPASGSNTIKVDVEKLDYPALTMTDVKLKDFTSGKQHPMIFSGGFMGVSQNQETGALRPSIGWMTFYKGTAEKVEPIDTSVEPIDENSPAE